MGEPIIIDDNGAAAGVNPALTVHDPDTAVYTNTRLRLAGLFYKEAAIGAELGFVAVYNGIYLNMGSITNHDVQDRFSTKTATHFRVEANSGQLWVDVTYEQEVLTLTSSHDTLFFKSGVDPQGEMYYLPDKYSVETISVWDEDGQHDYSKENGKPLGIRLYFLYLGPT